MHCPKRIIGSRKKIGISLFRLCFATKPLSSSLFFWDLSLLYMTDTYVYNTQYMLHMLFFESTKSTTSKIDSETLKTSEIITRYNCKANYALLHPRLQVEYVQTMLRRIQFLSLIHLSIFKEKRYLAML